MRKRISTLAVAALLAFGMLGGVAAAAEEGPKCPDQTVGSTIHDAEEPFEGTPLGGTADLVLHQTAEPLACSLPLP